MDYLTRLDKLYKEVTIPVIDVNDDNKLDMSDITKTYDIMYEYLEDSILRAFEGVKVKSTEAIKRDVLVRLDKMKKGAQKITIAKSISKLNNEKDIENFIKNSREFTKEEKKALIDGDIRFKASKDTKGLNSTNGVYTPKRKALHNKIANSFLMGKIKQKQPKVIFLAGVGGSGKSTALKAMGLNKKDYVIVDADAIKAKLPEFSKEPSMSRALLTHQESSDIVTKIIDEAIKQKLHLIVDGTMKNESKTKRIINSAKQHGYSTSMVATQLPTHKAMDRNIKRYEEDEVNPKELARFVPLPVIKKMGKEVNNSIHKMKKEFDNYAIYDTDVKKGENPILLEKGQRKRK